VIHLHTKKPIANAAVSGRAPGVWWENAVYARTDAAGRYTLVGLANVDCELTFGVVGPAYLMLSRTVRPTPGLAPATLDMQMVKGTVVTGRVTDKVTGKPVRGGIRYATLSGNKHLLGLPGKDIHGQGAMSYSLDDDGRFRFVAPPGPGIIVVQAREQTAYPMARILPRDRGKPYLRKEGGLGEVFISSSSVFNPLSSYHAYRLIDPAVGAEKLSADVQLDPGKAVVGKVVGPDGKPFAGATVAGVVPLFEDPTTLKGDTFTVAAVLPEDNRTVAAVHAGNKLAGTVVVRGSGKPAPVLRLAPWGAITGRLVGPDGKPVTGAQVRLYYEDRAAERLQGRLGDGKVTTDVDGQFRHDVPFAGVGVDLTFSHKGKYLETRAPQRGLTVRAGETRALGDIAVTGED
jgi:hypothetical protein